MTNDTNFNRTPDMTYAQTMTAYIEARKTEDWSAAETIAQAEAERTTHDEDLTGWWKARATHARTNAPLPSGQYRPDDTEMFDLQWRYAPAYAPVPSQTYPSFRRALVERGFIIADSGEWTDAGRDWLDANFDGITPRTQRAGVWPNDEDYPDFDLGEE